MCSFACFLYSSQRKYVNSVADPQTPSMMRSVLSPGSPPVKRMHGNPTLNRPFDHSGSYDITTLGMQKKEYERSNAERLGNNGKGKHH
ncbi:hypothetical protein VTN00DRAFT_6852 [Thermoascus crustaceus]|uniref:uncharacterized protein n=1 Tax=Thermoascus crustaceus TaxID=5088 RepID=UPI0037438496